MKRYEKCLKSVLDLYNVDCIPVYCPSIPDISEAEFRFLAAKGFVELRAAATTRFMQVPRREA